MNRNLSKLCEVVKEREAWQAAIHGVTKTWTWFSDLKTLFFFYLLSKNNRNMEINARDNAENIVVQSLNRVFTTPWTAENI